MKACVRNTTAGYDDHYHLHITYSMIKVLQAQNGPQYQEEHNISSNIPQNPALYIADTSVLTCLLIIL